MASHEPRCMAFLAASIVTILNCDFCVLARLSSKRKTCQPFPRHPVSEASHETWPWGSDSELKAIERAGLFLSLSLYPCKDLCPSLESRWCYFLRPPPCKKLPFFNDLHQELSKSKKQPFSASYSITPKGPGPQTELPEKCPHSESADGLSGDTTELTHYSDTAVSSSCFVASCLPVSFQISRKCVCGSLTVGFCSFGGVASQEANSVVDEVRKSSSFLVWPPEGKSLAQLPSGSRHSRHLISRTRCEHGQCHRRFSIMVLNHFLWHHIIVRTEKTSVVSYIN